MNTNLQLTIYGQDELKTELGERCNDTDDSRWTAVQKYQAINAAVRRFSTRVELPHLYTISGGFVSGTYTYALPDYMTGRIDPEYKRVVGIYTGNSDTTDRIWEDVTNYEVDVKADGTREMRLSFSQYNTSGRIIWWAANGPIPTSATLPVTSEAITSSSTEVLLTTLPRVPESGYIKINNEIMFYAGTVDSGSTKDLQGLVRAQGNTTAASHSSGDTVYWCVAVHRDDLYEQLFSEAMVYLHAMALNDSSQQERSHHESQLLFYQEMADDFWKRYTPERKTRMRLNRRSVGPGVGNTDYVITQVG